MDLGLFLTSINSQDTTGGPVPPVIANAPSGLNATADLDSIYLEWLNADTYDKIFVERKSTGEFALLDTILNGLATNYDDTTAAQGVVYTYRIRGFIAPYPTPFTNEASATIEEV